MNSIRTTWTQLSRDGLRGDRYGIGLLDDQNSFLPLPLIRDHIREFLYEASERPQMRFEVEPIQSNFAARLKPFFADAPPNVILPEIWKK